MPTIEQGNMLHVLPTIANICTEYGVEHRVLGGAATQAMVQASSFTESTEFHAMYLGADAVVTTIRDNGTPRDADVLVMTTNKKVVDTIYYDAQKATKGKLGKLSVFGLGKHEDVVARGSVRANISDFTSDRTMDEQGNMYLVCHPFIRSIDPLTHQAWTVFGSFEGTFNTVSPVAQQLAYQTRPIGGIRPRDVEKVAALQAVLDEKLPGFEVSVASIMQEWHQFKLDLLLAVEFEQDWSLATTARARLSRYLNSKQWAVNAAQGEGVLGKMFAPIQTAFVKEGKEPKIKAQKDRPLTDPAEIVFSGAKRA